MADVSIEEQGEWQIASTLQRNFWIAAPFTLLVPVAFGAAFWLAGLSLQWIAVGIGASGWLLALALRSPIAAVTGRLTNGDRKRAQMVLGWFSGPCEEIVRVAAVLLIGRSFVTAFSIGLGCATIEVVYTLFNGLVILSLWRRTDEKARQARALLKSMGMDHMLKETSPFLGILERISASAVHIAHTLLLAWRPLLVLATIPLHSTLNMLVVRLARRSPLLAELGMLLYGTLIFLFGLALFGRF